VADPDLELRGLGRFVLLALPVFLPSVTSSFFTQSKGGGGGGRFLAKVNFTKKNDLK